MNIWNEDRFWRHIRRRSARLCWDWIAYKNEIGYGITHRNKERLRAHRVAWELTMGEIPHGLFVLHKCDNPACCNPSHLFLGTQTDNMKDMRAKGREYKGPQPRGENSAQARFTAKQIYIIRADPRPQRTIAQEYGVSQAAISLIKRRINWGHLP